jgi:hypothetical protein
VEEQMSARAAVASLFPDGKITGKANPDSCRQRVYRKYLQYKK